MRENASSSRLPIGKCHDIEYGDLDQVVAETIPALRKLQEQGKVRFVMKSTLRIGGLWLSIV